MELTYVVLAALAAGVAAGYMVGGNGWARSRVAGSFVLAGGLLPFPTFLICLGVGNTLGLQIALVGAAGSLILPFIGACIYPLVDRSRRGALSAGLCLLPLAACFGYVHLLFKLFASME
jgi:hypothetical protein